MTYGNCEKGYKERVEKLLHDLKLNGMVLKEYLTSEESLSISIISNFMLNLRENDAFNKSMVESLISNAIVINGSWLPYKMLTQKGIHHIEINDIEELSVRLTKIFSELDNHKSKAKKIPDF
ncbi:MAG: hypothetical protein HC905_11390 [Bacteroidales bacterium]|nr:hypothetical protein [Bacteroidales bacterium]